MKLPRVLAVTSGIALIGASTLAFAASASAEEILAPEAPFPYGAGSYPAGWFTADGSVGNAGNDSWFGLTICSEPLTADSYQVLNGTPIVGDLTDLVADARFWVPEGTANFQIPVFGDPGAADPQATTLSPVVATVPGSPTFGPNDAWITSSPFGSFAAGASATLAQFENELSAGTVPGYQIRAFGAIVSDGGCVSTSQITFAGNTHLFREAPTSTQSAASVTASQFSTTGITFTVRNLAPREPVVISGGDANGSGIISEDEVADSSGTYTFTLAAPADTPAQPGQANFSVFGAHTGFRVDFDFAVTGDAAAPAPTPAPVVPAPTPVVPDPAPVVPAPAAPVGPAPATPAATPRNSAATPELAETGSDATAGVLAAGALLTIGSVLGIVALRHRNARA